MNERGARCRGMAKASVLRKKRCYAHEERIIDRRHGYRGRTLRGENSLFVLVLMTLVSGCASLISNSENFYRDAPRRPIHWREYLTD
jgi:hypothetical protein